MVNRISPFQSNFRQAIADALNGLFGNGTADSIEATDASVSGTLTLGGTAVDATALELNRAADVSARMVAGGSALAATVAAHDGRIIELDTATGTVVTLPAATGSGAVFRFLVTTLATSNSHVIQVASAADIIQGIVTLVDTDTAGTVTGFASAADSDTITLNRSTTGSVTIGEWLEIVDVASGVFTVKGQLSNTGSGATPFSAAVS